MAQLKCLKGPADYFYYLIKNTVSTISRIVFIVNISITHFIKSFQNGRISHGITFSTINDIFNFLM